LQNIFAKLPTQASSREGCSLIVAKIAAKAHPGCWASDTSRAYPSHIISLRLGSIDDIGYDVLAIFQPRTDDTSDDVSQIISAIGNHRLCKRVSLFLAPPQTPVPIYKIELRDLGFTRALVRAILEDSDARLPPHQKMTADNGEEIIYAVFRNADAALRVQKILGRTVGHELINFSMLGEDVSRGDVFRLVPCFYDDLIPNKAAEDLKDILAQVAEERLDQPSLLKRLSRVTRIIDEHPWIILIAIEILKVLETGYAST